jgi:hypothetical protein
MHYLPFAAGSLHPALRLRWYVCCAFVGLALTLTPTPRLSVCWLADTPHPIENL